MSRQSPMIKNHDSIFRQAWSSLSCQSCMWIQFCFWAEMASAASLMGGSQRSRKPIPRRQTELKELRDEEDQTGGLIESCTHVCQNFRYSIDRSSWLRRPRLMVPQYNHAVRSQRTSETFRSFTTNLRNFPFIRNEPQKLSVRSQRNSETFRSLATNLRNSRYGYQVWH